MDVFTAISLCSGYEGLGLGLKRAIPNIRTICYVENEAYAIANLVAKIKEKRLDDAPVWDDIKTFDPKPFTGMVDIIHSGYPCQGESVAGKRQGKADPRWLWPYIERIIETVQPLWFFGENVSGHLTLGFPTVYRSLRDMGYTVEAGLFGTEELGEWHERERLFILAHSSSRNGTSRTSQVRIKQPPIQDMEKKHPPVVWCKDKGRFRNEPTKGFNSKPLLDRRMDGSDCRMDRLRLLGNGVVPQQAEKAFKHLIRKFE